MHKLRLVGFVLIAGLSSSLAYADIYKWQDENGRWHFGDAKPKKFESETIGVSKGKTPEQDSPASGKDIATQLAERFPSEDIIAKATLSVVAIETHLGGGSGFFVSERGHIITNKHVVRPDKSKNLEQTQDKLEEAVSKLDRVENYIKTEEKQLAKLEANVKKASALLAKEPESSYNRPLLESRLQQLQSNYEMRKSRLEEDTKNYRTQRKEVEGRLSEINWKATISGVANTFKVYLKDDKTYTARLVKVSQDHDLALLQINGSTTPKLGFAMNTAWQQGDKVHAIGSPLGIRDTVTSGTITRIDREYIYTDAQILPGNSGGPLINDKGEVVGVNTQKIALGSVMNQGFGRAIPLDKVLEEFKGSW